MTEVAGFHCRRIGFNLSRTAPLVLLHGSGGSELSMVGFARSVALNRVAFTLRGRVPWEGGFAFFRRNPDRTLDQADLAVRSAELCELLCHLKSLYHRRPLLAGFSNGAIIAAAAVLQAPELSSGAILLRPLSPYAATNIPPLLNYPVLILGGVTDERRKPSDTQRIAEQFERSGALVTTHLLHTGHGVTALDRELARAWLADRGSM